MSTFGEDLIQSLNEALAHRKGEGPAIVHTRVTATSNRSPGSHAVLQVPRQQGLGGRHDDGCGEPRTMTVP